MLVRRTALPQPSNAQGWLSPEGVRLAPGQQLPGALVRSKLLSVRGDVAEVCSVVLVEAGDLVVGVVERFLDEGAQVGTAH
jgi:hypothetical protein